MELVSNDIPVVAKNGVVLAQSKSDASNDAHSAGDPDRESSHNPFVDPAVATHYRNLYERVQYECRHVFDPELSWTASEERNLVRKLDRRVCLWACIMFFALQVDRANLKQAVSDNMLNELHLSTNDYNFGNTVFLLSFLLAELPSQLVSKMIGPDRWIPVQMFLWSIVACSQAALTNKTTFLVTRALLGVLEVIYDAVDTLMVVN